MPARNNFYRPELDVLRLFAFLSVFLGHSELKAYLPWEIWKIQHAGNFGVCLFFFLSSYLITDLLLRERENTATIRLTAFYMRRTLRIWPLYFAFLAFCWFLSAVDPKLYVSNARFAAFLVFAGNWYTSRHAWTANPISPLWSISNEEQFYLVMPIIAKLGGRVAVAIGSAVLMPVGYITLFALTKAGANADYTIWTNSLVQFQFFAAGGLAALLGPGRVPRLRYRTRAVMVGGGLLLWFAASGVFRIKFVMERDYQEPWQMCAGYIAVLAGTVLIFFAFLGAGKAWTPKWAVYLGRISYGLYVFHFLSMIVFTRVGLFPKYPADPVTSGARVVLTIFLPLVVTIGLAAASYEYLEKPFLRLKERFTVA